ncbi:DUF4835 family protein [Agriterribacter sp.]|uniref:type IX secretion system protein PorD n=1 Tax=Agriterribacter sp. TaxID=2821509 RepID=UPI002BFDBB71|nr:DUF4835 family protein [Agriterribacter sp.]HRO47751.1 DUF4835 family protein [Agriterribacter sp.]HRQ18363.1 DUF4835 family protein [Agriterribacter sp.]
MYKLSILLVGLLFSCCVSGQELNAKVSVMAGQIKSSVDKKAFQTLQTALTNFLNNRKWTNDSYRQQEKIVCHFLLNVTQDVESNVYRAVLTIQAARPVYNSSYVSPLMNFQDNDVTFKYIEFQQVEFNESNITGSDPAASNLTAIFAYYVYMILGLDYDSFSPRGGDPYFKKAQQIVTGAPDGRNITGWKAFDGQRNRYWLSENFNNSKYSLLHDAYYAYYRMGLDKMYEDENEARQQVLNGLNHLNTLSTDNRNLMALQFFFLGRSEELSKLFKKSPPQERVRASELLQRLDIANAGTYKQELK